MEQDFKLFIKKMTLTLVALMLLTALFSITADAYGLFGIKAINRFNNVRPSYPDYSMESKVFFGTRIKPKTIILGSSRAEVGLNPDYEGFKYKPVFNLAVPKIRISGIKKLFEHMIITSNPKEVVLALDFFMFNALLEDRANEIAGLSSKNICKENITCFYFARIPFLMGKVWSFKAFLDSAKVFYYSILNITPNEELLSPHAENGLRIRLRNHLNKFPQRAIFWAYEIYYLFGDMWLDNKRSFEFVNPKTGLNVFNELEAIFSLAHKKGTKVHVVVLPSHARLWETMFTLELGDKFEEWKTKMVHINERVAENLNKQPFNVWDFSGYNHITSEKVPTINDKNARMKNYLDNSHFTTDIGNIVLDTIKNNKSYKVEGFGRNLKKETLEDDIVDMMIERNIWLVENMSDALEINLLYNDKRNRDIIKDPFLDMDN